MSLWTSRYGQKADNEEEGNTVKRSYKKPEVLCFICGIPMRLDEYTKFAGLYICPKCKSKRKVRF